MLAKSSYRAAVTEFVTKSNMADLPHNKRLYNEKISLQIPSACGKRLEFCAIFQLE